MASISIHTKNNPDAHLYTKFESYHTGGTAEFVVFKLYVGREEVMIFLTPEKVAEFKATLRKALVDSTSENEKYLEEMEAQKLEDEVRLANEVVSEIIAEEKATQS